MIIIPATFETWRSLVDKTYRLTFGTNELTPENVGAISASVQTYGYLAFKTDKFVKKEVEIFKTLESDFEDTGKTRAQRLRGVLYRVWETDKQGYEVFDDYYAHHMEKLINHFKAKLP